MASQYEKPGIAREKLGAGYHGQLWPTWVEDEPREPQKDICYSTHLYTTRAVSREGPNTLSKYGFARPSTGVERASGTEEVPS